MWTHDALQANVPVYVIAEQSDFDMDYIKHNYAPLGATVLYPIPKAVIDTYSPSGKTTVNYLRQQRVIASATGNGALDNVLQLAQDK